jgi:hypothetical protein
MADITPVAPTMAGANPSGVSASGGGDAVLNPRGNVIIRVTNGGGSSITVTLAVGPNPTRPSDGTFPAMTLANNVVTVPNGQSRIIGPVPPAFNDGNGKVQLTYSAVTSVTVEAYQPS